MHTSTARPAGAGAGSSSSSSSSSSDADGGPPLADGGPPLAAGSHSSADASSPLSPLLDGMSSPRTSIAVAAGSPGLPHVASVTALLLDPSLALVPPLQRQGSNSFGARPRADVKYLYGDVEPDPLDGGQPKVRRTLARQLDRWVTSLTGKISSYYSFRRKISIILLNSPVGNGWDMFQVLLTLVSCSLYVVSTYSPWNTPEGQINPTVDLIITALFTFDYFLRLYVSTNRYIYPFTFFAIVDLLACLPVYIEVGVELANPGANSSSSNSVQFVRFVRVLRVLRIVRSFKIINSSMSVSGRAMSTLALTVLCLIFLGAGLFHVVEEDLFPYLANRGAGSGGLTRDQYDALSLPGGPYATFLPPSPGKIFFLDACYFMVVTLFTVGYGDFYPITTLGRFIIVILIIMTIVILPVQLNGLTEALASVSAFRVRHVHDPTAPHVLVIGACETQAPAKLAADLLHEFFHIERTNGLREEHSNAMCIMLGNNEPPEDVRGLLLSPLLGSRVKYVRASVFRREDLQRVSTTQSEAIFLVSDACLPAGPAAAHSDTETALRAVMVKAHAPHLPTVMLCHDPQTALVMDTNDQTFHVTSTFEWRACMLTGAAIMPGFAALMSDLIRSASAPRGKIAIKRTRHHSRHAAAHASSAVAAATTQLTPPTLDPWQIDTATAASNRVLCSPLPDELEGMSFADAAALMYELSSGAVTAVAVYELPALTNSVVGAQRVHDMQRRFIEKSLLAEELLRAMAFLPQDTLNTVAAGEMGPRVRNSQTPGSSRPGTPEGASDPRLSESRTNSSAYASADHINQKATDLRRNTIEREIIAGKVLLNPGAHYRVRGGQLILVIATSDEAAEQAFEPATYRELPADHMPPQLPAAGREAEEGFGFALNQMPGGARMRSYKLLRSVSTLSGDELVRSGTLYPLSEMPNRTSALAAAILPGSAAAAALPKLKSSPKGMTFHASMDTIGAAVLKANSGNEAERAAAIASIKPTKVVYSDSVNSAVAVDNALRPIVCRDARKLSSPRAEGHVIISCSVAEAAHMVTSIRRRRYLERFGCRPALVIVLLEAGDLERCTIAQAHHLLALEDTLLVRGSADKAEALGRCALEHARAIILTVSGSQHAVLHSSAGDEVRSAKSEPPPGDLANEKASRSHHRAERVPFADLAFQYSAVLRTLRRIRDRRIKALAMRETRRKDALEAVAAAAATAAAKAAAIAAAAGRTATSTTRRPIVTLGGRVIQPDTEPEVDKWEGPTVVLELRSMDDISLLQTVANESMSQLLASSTAGENEMAMRQRSLQKMGELKRMSTGSSRTLKVAALAVTAFTPKAPSDATLTAAPAPVHAPAAVPPSAPGHAPPPGYAPLPPLQQPTIRHSHHVTPREKLDIETSTGSPLAFSSSIYASGNLYVNSILYAQLVGTYYNPLASNFLRELLSPADSRGGSVLSCADVPTRFHHESYAALVDVLRQDHDAIAIALYRFAVPARDGHGAPAHYTLVCPPPDMPLFSTALDGCDRVFVLSHEPVRWLDDRGLPAVVVPRQF